VIARGVSVGSWLCDEREKGRRVQEMEGLVMGRDHTEPGHHEELAVSG